MINLSQALGINPPTQCFGPQSCRLPELCSLQSPGRQAETRAGVPSCGWTWEHQRGLKKIVFFIYFLKVSWSGLLPGHQEL